MNARPSTLAMLVVGALWVALLWGSSVEASTEQRGRSRTLKSTKDSTPETWYTDAPETYPPKIKTGKSCKSGDCLYEDELEELIDLLDGNHTAGNNTNVTNVTHIEDEVEEPEEYHYGKSSKKSKKSNKGSKGSKGSKGAKSIKSSKKSEKSCKKSSKKGDCVDDDAYGYTPTVAWNATFPDAVATGYLFYDPVTEYAWYAYTAEAGEDLVTPPSADVEVAVAAVKTGVVDGSALTIGKICPMDVASNGKILSELCIEIPAAENATSTEIVTVEVCPSSVNDAILKMAVVVEDTALGLVGSRLIVYDTVAAGEAGSDAIILENVYEGWRSLYGEPGINGKPAFTPDCKTIVASWLLPFDGGEIDLLDTLTIATGIETKTSDDTEVWRLGTSGRLAGLTATKDGKSFITAANIPPEDDLNIGGIVKLDASDGSIQDQFIWPENSLDLPHNAFTNPLVDTDGSTYYIDSLLGLVKFQGNDLDDGPVWSAVGGYYGKADFVEEATEVEEMSAETSEIDVRRLDEKKAPFTAYQPALDESSSTVYGCGMTTRGDEYDGVIALESSKGYKVWHTRFTDYQVVNVGSCRGITDDIIFGPSTATESGNAVYVVRENVIHALDATNGTSVWRFEMHGPGITRFVVVSESLVIAANTGLVVGLDSVEPSNSTEVPSASPTVAPQPVTPRPTRAPLPPTPPPSSASTLGFSFLATALAALPLVLALLR